MINNYKTMSTRYLKQNKKRTLLTLIGIILSISLISTIGLFVKGAEKSEIENTKQADGFSFNLGYKTYTQDILNKVANNPNVKHYGIMASDNKVEYNKIYLDKSYVDKGAAEIFKYSVKKGRMPKNSSEICIDEWAKSYIKSDLDIGKEVVLEGKKYTLVGFLKNQDYTQRAKTSRAITFSENIKSGQLLVEINTKGNFKETLETLSSLTNKENLLLNYSLNRFYEMGSNKAIVTIVCIIIAIVVSATIIVIYNSFQINVAERMKQFGLLRSIGATKRQIKSIVFREATILLIIAIPIGLLLSVGSIYGINAIFKMLLKENSPLSIISIDIGVLIVSTIITILAVYISSLAPANYVGNISPLVAINSRVVIKKEVVKKRKYNLLKKLFNYKVIMAVKNVRRNPRRFRVMILSIIVSSVLFITFTSFMKQAFMLKNVNVEYQNVSLEVSKTSDVNKKLADYNLVEKINKLNNVDKVYIKFPEVLHKAEIPLNKRINEAGNIFEKQKFGENNKEVIYTKINAYDKVALDIANKYLATGSIDINNMNSQNGVILVSKGKARDYKNKKLYIGKLTDYKVNDEIIIHSDNKDYKVKVMAVINEDIFEREMRSNTMTLITTEQVLEKITGVKPQIDKIEISLKDDSLNLKTALEANSVLQDYPDYSATNFVDVNANEKSSKIMIEVLVYGFIFVITLISSINIINTITMNITLRRKESAMLKSIGMSQKDLKKMIMYEGLFYGVFGGALGAIVGCACSYAIYTVLSDVVILQWKLPWKLSLITIAVATLISYLSTLLPMKKIEKDNVIEAIREE